MSNGTHTTLDAFEALPLAESSRRIDFDDASLTPDGGGDSYDLAVSGMKPYLNMEVALIPRATLDGDFLQYEVVGTLPGIGLPALAPYSLQIKVVNILDREGIEVIGATRRERLLFQAPLPDAGTLVTRKNQKDLTQDEVTRLNAALQSLHDSGRYMDFVNLHSRAMTTTQGQTWGAHNMGASDGRNFLTWHREYLRDFEVALQDIDPQVSLPYWDWENDRDVPPVITVDLASWGVTRNVGGAFLPGQTSIDVTRGSTTWDQFRSRLESIHNPVHVFVGGTMRSEESPHDPIFWLHHGFVDKFWADWQVSNPNINPTHMSEQLQPRPPFDLSVADTLSTAAMGYSYG